MDNRNICKEEFIEEKILLALVNIQKNKTYYGMKENDINDGLRDMLSMVFECADQTRQGESETRIESGNVDFLIKNNSIPISIIEAIRVDYLDKERISKHLIKMIDNYDKNGCRIVNFVIYAMMTKFSIFWDNLKISLDGLSFPYEVESSLKEIDTGLAESRHGLIKLNREDNTILLHIYAIHLKEGNKNKEE